MKPEYDSPHHPGPLHVVPSPAAPKATERSDKDKPVEQDPAVERGERLDTGKTIQRGGKTSEKVKGATEQP